MRSSRTSSVALGALSFLILIGIWSVVTYAGFVQPLFLPTPTAFIRGLIDLFLKRGFIDDILISTFRVFAGFSSAALLGIPLGIAIGLNRTAKGLLEPVVSFVRHTPPVSLIPLFILWFGIGETEKVFMIFQTVFFPLVLLVANAISFTPTEIVESAETLGATRWQIISRVMFPFSLPRIYDDLRVCVGWAWSALVAAEIVGSTSGIGLVIVAAGRLLRTPQMIVGILTIAVLGLATDLIMIGCRPVLFPWAPKLDRHA